MVTYLTTVVVPAVQAIFHNLLCVIPLSGTNTFTDGNGNSVQVANVDYYISFSINPVTNNNIVAQALVLSHDSTTNQPRSGLVNFNPQHWGSQPSDKVLFDSFIRVACHEFTHALVFSPSLYDDYYDSATGIKYLAPTVVNNGITYLTTPAVVAFYQNHFACAILPGGGAPLEDQGGAGTACTHWEQAACGDEYMAGIKSIRMPFTGMTMALFEDSGWYKTNASAVEPFIFGYQEGCEFLQSPCTQANWQYEYCTGAGTSSAQTGCTFDNLGISSCIGLPTLPDNCGIISVFNPQTTLFSAESKFCTDTTQYANPTLGESFGCGSRCFTVPDPLIGTDQFACFETKCDNGTLYLNSGGTWYKCPVNGGKTSIGIVYNAICPPAFRVCPFLPADAATCTYTSSSGGYKWLFTNNTLGFWLVVGFVIIMFFVVLCLLWSIVRCMCERCGKSGI